jgi:hypothetical protein
VTSLISLALAAFVASGSSAQASLVAGWDFSQYAGDGVMSIDGGSTFTNTLSANYSDLDPTFGAGFESAAFGTMYVDGSFGSTSVAAGSGSEEFLPTAAYGGSLLSNLDAPAAGFGIQHSVRGAALDRVARDARAVRGVVFEADLTGMSLVGSNWSVASGGRPSGSSSVRRVLERWDDLRLLQLGESHGGRLPARSAKVPRAASGFVRLTFAVG